MSNDDVGLILKELREIRKELAYIKDRMLDRDSVLTTEELVLLKKAEKEFEEGKTIKLEDIKGELSEV